jgi:carboxyl-terminal processing protease
MQVVLPMDTTVTYENYTQKQTENYLKVTVSKLYRVNGTTAQFKGVQPDIALPDVLDAYITREDGEPYALRPSTIAPNKYYTPYPYLPLKTIAESVQKEIDTSKYFNSIKALIADSKQKKSAKDISLSLKDVDINATGRDDDTTASGPVSKKFTVQTNQYEMTRMQTDSDLKELNDEFSRQIAADAYISIAYDVLSKLKPK